MVIDAAPAWVEHGGSQQVIEVYEHGEPQNGCSPYPPRLIELPGDPDRYHKMKTIMNNGLQHATKVGKEAGLRKWKKPGMKKGCTCRNIVILQSETHLSTV